MKSQRERKYDRNNFLSRKRKKKSRSKVFFIFGMSRFTDVQLHFYKGNWKRLFFAAIPISVEYSFSELFVTFVLKKQRINSSIIL